MVTEGIQIIITIFPIWFVMGIIVIIVIGIILILFKLARKDIKFLNVSLVDHTKTVEKKVRRRRKPTTKPKSKKK